MAEEIIKNDKELDNAALAVAGLFVAFNIAAPQVAEKLPIPSELFLYAQIIGLSMHIIGRMVDSNSTKKLYDAVRKSEEMGISQHFRDISPILPDQPTVKDLVRPRVLLVDVVELFLTGQLPLIYGPFRLVSSVFAAKVNDESRKTVLENMKNPLR